MAFVVEDGTGLSTATSLVDVTPADTFWSDRGGNSVWTAASTAQKQAALVKASDYLRNQSRYTWSGTKLTYAQTMPWPRSGATELGGQVIPANVVPWQVAQAVCWLALLTLNGTDVQPALAHGGAIKSETVGPISTTYADRANPETVYPMVDGLVKPLLRASALRAVPQYTEPTLKDGWLDNQFTYVDPETDPTPGRSNP